MGRGIIQLGTYDAMCFAEFTREGRCNSLARHRDIVRIAIDEDRPPPGQHRSRPGRTASAERVEKPAARGDEEADQVGH